MYVHVHIYTYVHTYCMHVHTICIYAYVRMYDLDDVPHLSLWSESLTILIVSCTP